MDSKRWTLRRCILEFNLLHRLRRNAQAYGTGAATPGEAHPRGRMAPFAVHQHKVLLQILFQIITLDPEGQWI